MKKFLVALLSLMLFCACGVGAVTAFAADGTTDTGAGQHQVIYSGSKDINNWWWDGNVINLADLDAGVVNSETNQYKISADYTYFIFNIAVAEGFESKLCPAFKMGNNWLEFKPAVGSAYYTSSGGTFIQHTYSETEGIALASNFTGRVAVPLASYETTTAAGYDMYSLEYHHIVFHDLRNADSTPLGSTVSNLMFADQEYTFPAVEGEVNKIGLGQSIAAAKAVDVNGVQISVDGTDVNKGAFWVTQELKTAYTEALAEAERLNADENATQTEVDTAKAALDTAVKNFKDGIQEGTQSHANYGLIKSTHTVAQSSKVITEFEGGALTALNEFDKIKFTVDASEQTYDVNLSVLAKCDMGWEQGFVLAYSATEDLIDPAKEPSTTHTRADRYYLLKAAGDELAYRYMIDVVNNEGTGAEVGFLTIPAGFVGDVYVPYSAFKMDYNTEGHTIGGKLTEFNITSRDNVSGLTVQNIRFGTETVTEGLNVKTINATIAQAKALLAEIKTDTDGAATATTERWTTAEHKAALQSAITAAEEAVTAAGNDRENQAAVDAANETLITAIAAFEETLAAGTKNFYTILTGKIAAAETALNGVEISTTASEVDEGVEWVTVEVATQLNEAITAAKAVKETASQADFESAISALDSALATFNAEKKTGTKTENGNTGGNTEKPDEKSGCGSVAGSVGSVSAALALLGAAIVIAVEKKRRAAKN